MRKLILRLFNISLSLSLSFRPHPPALLPVPCFALKLSPLFPLPFFLSPFFSLLPPCFSSLVPLLFFSLPFSFFPLFLLSLLTPCSFSLSPLLFLSLSPALSPSFPCSFSPSLSPSFPLFSPCSLPPSPQITQAVKWLAERTPAPVLLSSEALVQFVEGGLCREFGSRLHQDKRDREGAGLPCQDPAPIVHLYNSVLLFLAGLVSCDSLAALSWPVAEFCLPETRGLLPPLGWNCPRHLAWLQRAILSLQIPEWDLPPTSGVFPHALKLAVHLIRLRQSGALDTLLTLGQESGSTGFTANTGAGVWLHWVHC